MTSDKHKITLLVSTYNWPEALGLVLHSLSWQTMLPDEVVIADDGSTADTAEWMKRVASQLPVPVKHVWQEDKGFRKSLILNKAVKAASGDYIIQIDGDIVMERHFIADHAAVMARGRFVRGNRAYLSERLTREWTECYKRGELATVHVPPPKGEYVKSNSQRNMAYYRLLYLLTGGRAKVLRVRGCNMAYWKADFVRVNGYNNDFAGWGWEDTEFAIRMHNAGVKIKKMKFVGIAYHLYHSMNSREMEERNGRLAHDCLESGISVAENGYYES